MEEFDCPVCGYDMRDSGCTLWFCMREDLPGPGEFYEEQEEVYYDYQGR